MTPGWMASRSVKLRPLRGTAVILVALMVSPTCEAGGVDGGHLLGDVDRLGLLFERQLDVEREGCAGSDVHSLALDRLEAGLAALDVVAACGQRQRISTVGPGGYFKFGTGGNDCGRALWLRRRRRRWDR